MTNLRRKYLIGLTLLFSLISFSIIIDDLNVNAQTKYLHADYEQDYGNVDLYDAFDYAFVGKVVSYINTSQYNGYGTNLPYSFFTVDVLNVYKGNIDSNIIIKFYGGYDNNNNLILFEDMELPEIGVTYIFHCQKTVLSFEDDFRTLDGCFPITMKYNMMEIDDLEIDEVNERFIPDNMTYAVIPPIYIDPGHQYNTSFENAYDLYVDTTRTIYLLANFPLYYKICRDSLDYVSFYSDAAIDVKITIYDSERNQIAYNSNVNTTHGLNYTSGNNFFLNFYTDANQLYYIKIESEAGESDQIEFHTILDNWSQSDPTDLLWNHDGVTDATKTVSYYVDSIYEEEIAFAVNEWSKLGSVSFDEKNIAIAAYVTIKDVTDLEENAPVATTTDFIVNMRVEYNSIFFINMSTDERIKTILHEFGHVLGLTEFTNLESLNNVMHQGIRELRRLGPADIGVYREKWG